METINECNRMKEYKLPEQINIPQTIILADGDFPSSSLAKEWLRECPYVVCCDGAVNTYLRFGKMPVSNFSGSLHVAGSFFMLQGCT